MKFSDLVFTKSDVFTNGERAIAKFSNGYGASVIRGPYSYGGDKGLYELAVITCTDDNEYFLCYSTPITDDVIGHLTPDEISVLLEKIEAL